MNCEFLYWLALFGWVAAGMFLAFYLKAQSKLDDYRVSHNILRALRQRWEKVDSEASFMEQSK